MIFKENLPLIISLFISSGFLGLVIGVINIIRDKKRQQLEALKEYYAELHNERISRIRREITDDLRKGIPFDVDKHDDQKENIGVLLDFYDKWSALCLEKYLPRWIFYGEAGYYITSTFDYLAEYIQDRRDGEKEGYVENPIYAFYYSKLVMEIKKYMRKQKKLPALTKQ
jgi:hypothetical protein